MSADSDLVPAIQTIRAKSPGTFVAAAFPPKRYSAHLKALMPQSMHIGMTKVNRAQLPDRVVDPVTGLIHERPSKWRRD